jgi:hypothetical protein
LRHDTTRRVHSYAHFFFSNGVQVLFRRATSRLRTLVSMNRHTPPREKDSLSKIGANLTSIQDIPDLQLYTSLRTLCLHGNNLTSTDGLQALVNLRELNLSSNLIGCITNISHLSRLSSLSLASNKLQHLHGLQGLSQLHTLNVSYNYITELSGLHDLHGSDKALATLNIKRNQLGNLTCLGPLLGCVHLTELHVSGNPMCSHPMLQQALHSVLPQLKLLDSAQTTSASISLNSLQATQQLATLQQLSIVAPSAPLQPQAGPAHHAPQQQRQTPHINVALSGFHRRRHNPDDAPPPDQPQPHYTHTVQPASSQMQPTGPPVPQNLARKATRSRQVQDSTTQTSETSMLVNRLQQEAAELRDKLDYLAGAAPTNRAQQQHPGSLIEKLHRLVAHVACPPVGHLSAAPCNASDSHSRSQTCQCMHNAWAILYCTKWGWGAAAR